MITAIQTFVEKTITDNATSIPLGIDIYFLATDEEKNKLITKGKVKQVKLNCTISEINDNHKVFMDYVVEYVQFGVTDLIHLRESEVFPSKEALQEVMKYTQLKK